MNSLLYNHKSTMKDLYCSVQYIQFFYTAEFFILRFKYKRGVICRVLSGPLYSIKVDHGTVLAKENMYKISEICSKKKSADSSRKLMMQDHKTTQT